MSLSHSERYFIPFDLCKANEIADESLRNFDSLITEFMKEQRIPGGAIALSYNGRLIHRQGYGSAGNESRCLSTSYFRIASISKTITAMAIMQLVEQNKMQLNDKIFSRKGKGILANFAPDGPSVKTLERITVRHLLEHSGGWDRETGVDPVYLPPQTVCPEEHKESTTPVALYTNYHTNLIKYMIKQTLDFKPGTRHGYSNFGYLVLGQVLEKLTGIPFPIYIHDIINQADDFWVYEGDELHRLHPNEVTYFENSNSLHPSIIPHQGDIWSLQYGGYHMKGTGSYGGLVASPLQLLSLLSTLDLEHCKGNRILSRESISQMLACPKFEKGSEWYGLGLDVEDKGQTWGHTGYMDGTTTSFRRDKSGYSWVLLFNAGATDQDLDGLVRFALFYCYGPSAGLNISSVNVKKQQISCADKAQIYQILIPLKEVEEHAYSLKSKGYYMQDIDLVVYENAFYVNMIWNHNVGNIDWFYKIYHDVSVSDLETEHDIFNQINSGFMIHTLSICTDSKCQTDIYTAVIYRRQRAQQTIQHLTHLKEISLTSPFAIESCSNNIAVYSVCYFCKKSYVSTVSEVSKSKEYSDFKADNDFKTSLHFWKEKHNQNLADTVVSGISVSYDSFSENNQRSPVCDGSQFPFVNNSSTATCTSKSCSKLNNGKEEKSSNIAKTNMAEDEFLDELRHQALLHYGLIYLQIYKLPSRKDIFISAVWSKFKVHECYQRLGASRFSFMNELLENSGKITPLETIRAYEEDGVLLFAGIWTAGKFRSKRPKTRKSNQNQSFKRKLKRAKLTYDVD